MINFMTASRRWTVIFVFLCIIAAMMLAPAEVSGEVEEPEVIIGGGIGVYAKGIPIYIVDGEELGETSVYYIKDGKREYVELIDPITKETGTSINLQQYNIYGGYKNEEIKYGSDEGTSITMTGGHVGKIFGGGGGYISAGTNAPIIGNTNITITGGKASTVYGGSDRSGSNTRIEGDTNITINGGEIGTVYGGGNYTPVTGEANITVSNGTVDSLFGGGNGHAVATAVGSVDINIVGGTFNKMICGSGGDKTIFNYVSTPVTGDIAVDITGGSINGDIYNAMTGKAKGNVTLTLNTDLAMNEGKTLFIAKPESGKTSKLTIATDKTLSIAGETDNIGKIQNNGIIDGGGLIDLTGGGIWSGNVPDNTEGIKVNITSVLTDLTGIETENEEIIKTGPYTATLVPNDGYVLPDSIAINVGGTFLMPDEYVYNKTTGSLSIPKTSIRGNLTLGATGQFQEELPNAGIGYIDEKITQLEANANYLIADEELTSDKTGTISIKDEWFGKELTIVTPARDITYRNSEPQILEIPERPAAPTKLVTKDVTQYGGDDGTITGVTSDMEYRYSADGTWEDNSWTDCSGDTITGRAGYYQIRKKAVEAAEGQAGNFVGNPKTVEVESPPKPTYILVVKSPQFDTVKYGYEQPKGKGIVISSEGNSDATVSKVIVSGGDADAFEVQRSDDENGDIIISAGTADETTYLVVPKAGLNIGSYTAVIEVHYNNDAVASTEVSFVVEKAEEPSAPTDPETPTDPTNPTPSEPANPTPSEPTDPSDSKPQEPSTETDPTGPTVPTKPESSEPTESTSNEKPSTESASTKPSTSDAASRLEAATIAKIKKNREKTILHMNRGLKVSQSGKKITVKYGKISEADGYDVFIQYCGKNFKKKATKTVKSGKTTSVKITKVNGKKLNLKKNYKVYIAAYKIVNGKKVQMGKTIIAHIVGQKNTKYTNVKNVKISKNKYTLKKGQTVKIKAKTVLVNKKRKELTNAHAKKFRYTTDNKKIATVTKTGKIRAVGKGKCEIHVYARNGYTRVIKVHVK